ncbi:MAG: Hsp70 family protein [Candidatus Bruticola sp.]
MSNDIHSGLTDRSKHWVVGIDLGTTNSAMSRLPLAEESTLESVLITQRISENQISRLSTLPSFLYLPGAHEMPVHALELPWNQEIDYAVGAFARTQSAKIPGRVVCSAKSWLAHRRAEPSEAILPWEAVKEGRKVSAIEASRRYLAHLRDSWDYDNPEHPLALQELVLTVPASFDEIARDLTVEAADRAGLENITLLEEPQSAFYTWLWNRRQTWRQDLAGIREILICDIGGGTCDFTAIKVDEEGLQRVAVGEHLMLGGDNLDIAIARLCESRMGVDLNLLQWGVLQQQCRQAKEKLLGLNPPDSCLVITPGIGSKLVDSALQAEVSRQEIQELILNGFFPEVPFDEPISNTRRIGLQEWGLPYASDPVVPHYMSAFLRTHNLHPQAILFNGGACRPQAIKQRICQILSNWLGYNIKVLDNEAEDLAVAHGACAFGWLRHHGQERIRGGTARSYYLGVSQHDALCVIHRNQDQGERQEIGSVELKLRVGVPAAFPLFASTERPQDRAGQVIKQELLKPLGTLETVAAGSKNENEVSVRLAAQVTEIGTMSLWATSLDGSRSWSLQLPLRGRRQKRTSLDIAPQLVDRAKKLIVHTFNTKANKLRADDIRPRALLGSMESYLGKRTSWPSALNRNLWEAFWQCADKRRSCAEYEAAWFNGAGFLLRPGIGAPLDKWRLEQMQKLLPEWIQFSQDENVRREFWVFWRRLAAGMEAAAQTSLWANLAPRLIPGRKHIKSRLKSLLPAEKVEIMRLAVSLERIPMSEKEALGETIFQDFKVRPDTVWQLSRLGARRLMGAGPQHVMPAELVGTWLDKILQSKWSDSRAIGLAAAEMARYTNNRVLDLDAKLRQRLADRLTREGLPSAAKRVMSLCEEEDETASVLFGEDLPIGLRLGV